MSFTGRGTRGVALLALAACGSGGSTPVDAMVDPCANVTCEGLIYCDQGQCVPYPSCTVDPVDAGIDPPPTCGPGTACRNDVCIPVDVDVDGDGFPAGTDCDEQDRDVHPGVPEVCNGVDDDCSMAIDDGDPAVLCAGDPVANVCMEGHCVCANGNFELDPTVPGCECAATPALDVGTSCETAVDLGDMRDLGFATTVTGNIPNGRQLWYRFRGVDTPDNTCDNYHVTAKLLDNPGDQFRIRAFRGSCATPLTSVGEQFTIVEWATDMRQNIHGVLTGQCPCWSGTPVERVSWCQDDTADYFIVVERVTGGADTCAPFRLEMSNGLYDWQG